MAFVLNGFWTSSCQSGAGNTAVVCCALFSESSWRLMEVLFYTTRIGDVMLLVDVLISERYSAVKAHPSKLVRNC